MLTTTDATTALRAHEYSPSPPPSLPRAPDGNPSLLAHMPLSLLSSVMGRQHASSSSAESPPSPVHGHVAARTSAQTSSKTEPETGAPATSPSASRPASSSSTASTDERLKKRSHRPKTTYNLAQPPPVHAPRHKLHLRPKVLLQLHQVIPDRRPKPVYEVIPFSLLAPRSTRRLARTWSIKGRLCSNAFLVVKAEEYGAREEEGRTDDERWGSRDVIGIICPSKKADKDSLDKTDLLMDDGSIWEVTHLPNGGYEFNYTDEHGLALKSRWVPKPVYSRRTSSMTVASPGQPATPDDKKFNFSTISANSRRHPVIATMCRASIDVLESYSMPTATSPGSPAYPPSGVSTPVATPQMDADSFMEKCNDRLPIKTDDALRRFIVVSGIWVSFCENWSAAYSLSKSISSPYPLSIPNVARPPPNRTVSMSILDSPRSPSPASTNIDENRRTIPRLFRAGSQKLHRNTSLHSPIPSPASTKTTPSSSPKVKARSRRANSTGTAELGLGSGSVRRRYGLAPEDETLPETEEERQSRRSTELLRIKELQLPDPPSPDSAMPAPVTIIEPPSDSRSSPPLSPTPRAAKAQSAFEPITTTGLWDSGVADGGGVKSRPTSWYVVKEKKDKAKKKKAREKELVIEGPPKHRFRQRLLGMFRREKT